MAPSNSKIVTARAIALRIKGVAMKRSRAKSASKAASPKKATAATRGASPKKRKTASKASIDASPKKRKAASKASTAASPKKRTSRRRNVTKSNKGTTMSKSSNNSQFDKTNDSEEVENITGGLKLLKRKMVTMSQISTGVIRGQQFMVQLNDKGEPIGKEGGNMQSFIGVQARTKIPINISDWRDVDDDEKQKIWESVQVMDLLYLIIHVC